MALLKKALKAFHSTESFKKYGLKQVSTWAGILIFICVFDTELLTLVHNVLTNANLSEKLSSALAGLILVWFNKLEKK